ncbi:MAG: AAA family ATPase [Armatimonadetes bacterium]|nr:AAA family ATPase [Armatimonadota bacterium]
MEEPLGRRALRSLLKDGSVSLEFGDRHPNQFIKALREEPLEGQIARFAEWERENREPHEPKVALRIPATEHSPEIRIVKSEGSFCVYPTPQHLATVVNAADYAGKPFTLRLARGEPQLGFEVFDLSVLEHYRNDPRYYYQNDDILGTIYLAEHPPRQMPESDQVYLQAFGFAYDEKLNRVLAAWLWDLSCLSPEHQQLWNAKRAIGEYKLHPDFYRGQVLGEWYEGISVFGAFIEQVKFVNEACTVMGRPALFRNVLSHEDRPREFGFLLRPTLKDYNSFVHLLDKLLSENVSFDFFRNEITREREIVRKDGKTIVEQKGSLQVMEEWLKSKYPPEAAPDIEDMMEAFKNVRRQRQKPAHAVEENRFDNDFVVQQRKLMEEVVGAMNTLCSMCLSQSAVKAKGMKHPLEGRQVWPV